MDIIDVEDIKLPVKVIRHFPICTRLIDENCPRPEERFIVFLIAREQGIKYPQYPVLTTCPSQKVYSINRLVSTIARLPSRQIEEEKATGDRQNSPVGIIL